jgi:hypothetical protein
MRCGAVGFGGAVFGVGIRCRATGFDATTFGAGLGCARFSFTGGCGGFSTEEAVLLTFAVEEVADRGSTDKPFFGWGLEAPEAFWTLWIFWFSWE